MSVSTPDAPARFLDDMKYNMESFFHANMRWKDIEHIVLSVLVDIWNEPEFYKGMRVCKGWNAQLKNVLADKKKKVESIVDLFNRLTRVLNAVYTGFNNVNGMRISSGFRRTDVNADYCCHFYFPYSENDLEITTVALRSLQVYYDNSTHLVVRAKHEITLIQPQITNDVSNPEYEHTRVDYSWRVIPGVNELAPRLVISESSKNFQGVTIQRFTDLWDLITSLRIITL